MAAIDKKQEIMAVGKLMVQAHGYNALSFREIAKVVGVKSASVHYHFPTKGDLGAALARRYTEDGVAYLGGLLEDIKNPAVLMQRYIEIFRSVLENENRMCLCGIMAAERAHLPIEVRVEVGAFIDANVAWLTKVVELTGMASGKVAEQQALAIFGALEGAQLIARGRGAVEVYDQMVATYRTTGLMP
jgi:TetR/AcrR family transcriptional repressor of nem operon